MTTQELIDIATPTPVKAEPRPLSASWLKKIDESPLRYWWDLNNPQPDKPAFTIGRAVHCLVFEPERFEERFIIYTGARKAGAGWQEFKEAAGGKDILKDGERDECARIADAVRSHPIAKGLLEVQGEAEKELEWTHERTGRRCRGRVDFVSPVCLPDLKTAQSIDPHAFYGAFVRFRYDMQMAFYSDGVRAAMGEEPPVYIIAAEKSAPYDVAVDLIPEPVLMSGRVRYEAAIDRLIACEQSDQWPGAYPDLRTLALPGWAEAAIEDELTFDGEGVF